MGKKQWTRLLIFLSICVFLPFKGWAQETNYKSQSLYIYKFCRYISWPESTSENDFVISVYGNSAIFEELKIMASLKKAANGRNIVIKRLDRLSDIGNEQMLYLSSSRSRELRSVQEAVGDRPILVITERDGLARKGAAINFMIMENETLKFEVNKAVLRARQLEIAPELLRMGFEVG
ncbi:MAG: YfiR family protein [Bacteroidota bacterium]